MTIYRVTIEGTAPAEVVLYLPLTGNPLHEQGARFDHNIGGPHLCRATAPDGEQWHGELMVDEDDDGRTEAVIAWVDWDDYETDVSDLFAAPLKCGRLFRARHFQAFDDAWDLRVVRLE